MRINFLFSGSFWGIILILFGFSVILRSFNINIPFGRIVFGLIFLYIGIVILFGGSLFTTNSNFVLFNNINIEVEENIEDEYSIIFGSGIIDLTGISEENLGEKLEINIVFGSGTVFINSDLPVKIEASSAFGKATMPDGNSISFGNYNYASKNIESNSDNVLLIEANTVFGSLDIRNR